MERRLTPMKAIRLKCLECCCNQTNEVKLCTIKDCALWAYRLGHKPDEMPTYQTPEMDEERRQLLAAQLRAVRPSKTNPV